MYMARPQHKNPCHWGHEIFITTLVDPSLVIITIYSVLSDIYSGVEKKIFDATHKFYTFPPKLLPFEMGGREIFNFPADATYQIL